MMATSYSSLLLIVMLFMANVSCRAKNPSHVKDSLSSHDHFNQNGEHNAEYDHDAFLGNDDAKEFQDLSPEESKERLRKLVSRMDTNSDKQVSEDELQTWITQMSIRSIHRETNRQLHEALNLTGNPEEHEVKSIAWDTYRAYLAKHHFDELQEEMEEDDDDDVEDRPKKDISQQKTKEIEEKVEKLLARDKRRWDAADVNHDGELSRDEFQNYLHPEELLHMRPVIIQEVLDEMDTNKDGRVDIKEFERDLTQGYNEENQIDWVEKEKAEFTTTLDINKDGVLDTQELEAWLFKPMAEQVAKEARHLMKETDADKDGLLSVDEIVQKHDLFVGSQATGYGDAINRHDEL